MIPMRGCIVPDPKAFYWNAPNLRLARGSIDGKFEMKTKRKATVPFNYVSDLQKDLIELGYLKAGSDDGEYGLSTERAVTRFQRHAARDFRWNGSAKSTVVAWMGMETGNCDASTAKEVRTWIANKFRLPLKLFQMTKIDGKPSDQLRADAAKVWTDAIDEAAKLGATLIPVGADPKNFYGDTWRNPAAGFQSTGGNSKLSLHYTGRAVDVSQALAGGNHQRWWVAREEVAQEEDDPKTFWRVFCKTDKQDGSQGTKIAKDAKKYYQFYNNMEASIPEGFYLDITKFLADRQFQRIPAHDNYKTTSKGLEWWHFHFTKDLQETFLDEMELIGVTEAQLKHAGWTEAEMDQPAG
jgi:hypothetical protein